MRISPVLSIRAFRDLWLGQAISQLGDALYYVIFMFMVKKITHSNEMVGYVGAAEAIPYLLFSPYAGVIADRADRRLVMLLSDLISGIILVSFAVSILLGHMPGPALMLILAFTLSSVRVFFLPAKAAAVPALVPGDLLMRANALSLATQNFMPLIGFSLSASVLGALYTLSAKWFFFTAVGINGLSFVLSAVYIARLPKIIPDRDHANEQHPIKDFKEGYRYIRTRHELVILMILSTVFRLMVAPFFVVYMAANDDWFGGKPQTLAMCELMFFAAMVIASPIIGRMNISRAGLSLSLGLVLVGLSVAAMAFSRDFRLFCFWNFIAGFGVPFADLPMGTYMQLSVPDAFRGRVNSVMAMAATAVVPIGTGMGGLMVQEIGLQGAFLIMGFGMALACFVGLLDSRFRAIEMPQMQAASTQ